MVILLFLKESSPYYGLENGLHADLSDAEPTKGEEKKHEGQVEKDEANFWKKYGDVHFDDISGYTFVLSLVVIFILVPKPFWFRWMMYLPPWPH